MKINNPLFRADMPDPDIIRAGSCFYMVSTTMYHTGRPFPISVVRLPITKSTGWKTADMHTQKDSGPPA